MGRELSFEWSHHRISSIVSKVSRVTSQNSIKNRGSERVNIDLETREMSYGTCESAKAIELDRDKRLNGRGGEGGRGREGQGNEPRSKTGVDHPHCPTPQGASMAHESNPPALAADLDKVACTRVYLYTKSHSRGTNPHTRLKQNSR